MGDCLKEYMGGFQARDPNYALFNAVLHMDEATPHLHIDYIPVGITNEDRTFRTASPRL